MGVDGVGSQSNGSLPMVAPLKKMSLRVHVLTISVNRATGELRVTHM